jgi:hypothetical protein
VLDILKVGCSRGTRGRPPAKSEFRAFLQDFRNQHFSNASKPSLDHLGNMLNYAANDIVRDIHNNIQMHYDKYVEKYIKSCHVADDDDKRDRGKIMKDLLNVSEDLEFCSPEKHHPWIREHGCITLPTKVDFEKNNIY